MYISKVVDLTNPENPVYEIKNGDISFRNVNFGYSKKKRKYQPQRNTKLHSKRTVFPLPPKAHPLIPPPQTPATILPFLKPYVSSVSRLPRKNLSLPTSSSPTEPLSICAVNFLRMRMKCSMYPV